MRYLLVQGRDPLRPSMNARSKSPSIDIIDRCCLKPTKKILRVNKISVFVDLIHCYLSLHNRDLILFLVDLLNWNKFFLFSIKREVEIDWGNVKFRIFFLFNCDEFVCFLTEYLLFFCFFPRPAKKRFLYIFRFDSCMSKPKHNLWESRMQAGNIEPWFHLVQAWKWDLKIDSWRDEWDLELVIWNITTSFNIFLHMLVSVSFFPRFCV